MEILIFIILAICVIMFLYKRFNISKKVAILFIIAFVVIGILIILLDRFNIINKLKSEIVANQPTITQEEREQAVAIIDYDNIMGFDARNL